MLTLILLLSNEFVLKTKSSILIEDFLLYKIFLMKKIIFLSFLFFFLLNSKTLAVQCDPLESWVNLEYFEKSYQSMCEAGYKEWITYFSWLKNGSAKHLYASDADGKEDDYLLVFHWYDKIKNKNRIRIVKNWKTINTFYFSLWKGGYYDYMTVQSTFSWYKKRVITDVGPYEVWTDKNISDDNKRLMWLYVDGVEITGIDFVNSRDIAKDWNNFFEKNDYLFSLGYVSFWETWNFWGYIHSYWLDYNLSESEVKQIDAIIDRVMTYSLEEREKILKTARAKVEPYGQKLRNKTMTSFDYKSFEILAYFQEELFLRTALEKASKQEFKKVLPKAK